MLQGSTIDHSSAYVTYTAQGYTNLMKLIEGEWGLRCGEANRWTARGNKCAVSYWHYPGLHFAPRPFRTLTANLRSIVPSQLMQPNLLFSAWKTLFSAFLFYHIHILCGLYYDTSTLFKFSSRGSVFFICSSRVTLTFSKKVNRQENQGKMIDPRKIQSCPKVRRSPVEAHSAWTSQPWVAKTSLQKL